MIKYAHPFYVIKDAKTDKTLSAIHGTVAMAKEEQARIESEGA